MPSAAVSLTESERKQLGLIYSHATTGRYFSQQHFGEAWPWSNCECAVQPSAVLRALISDLTTMHLLSKVDCSNIEAFLEIWGALNVFQINIYFVVLFFFFFYMSMEEDGCKIIMERRCHLFIYPLMELEWLWFFHGIKQHSCNEINCLIKPFIKHPCHCAFALFILLVLCWITSIVLQNRI